MARPTQYQKLSLQLDAENKKLKQKLEDTKSQMNNLKAKTNDLGKNFSSSFGQIGGAIGGLGGKLTGLISQVGMMNPALLAIAGAAGATKIAFDDLTAYTNSWEGALSDAGRSLKAVQTGFSSFLKLASQQRGQALAEGGIFGWIKEAGSQLLGLTNGTTQAMAGVNTAIAGVVNDAMLKWQQGILDTVESQSKLRAETQELYNQFRDKALIPEERLKAVNLYKDRALELYELQKNNAENELEYLLQEAKLSGNSFDENLKIEEKKAEINELEREYQRLLGRTIEYQNSITTEIEKNRATQYDFNRLMKETMGSQSFNIDSSSNVVADPFGIEQVLSQFTVVEERADEFRNLVGNAQQELIDKWGEMAQSVGTVATGIAITKKNWAAMASAVLSGGAQIIKAVNGIIAAKRVAVMANQAEAVAGATSSGAQLPYPANLIAIATGVATVLATIAPYVGSFARGTDYVPKTGMAMVHKGEKIIPAGEADTSGFVEFEIKGDVLYGVLDEYNRRRGNRY